MARNQWKRPSKDEMVRGVAEHGTVTAYARSIVVPRNTVAHWAEDYGIKSDRMTVRPTEAKPVDDPDRLRIKQQEAVLKELKRENKQYAERLASQEDLFQRIVDVSRLPVEVPKLVVPRQNPELPKRTVILPIFDIQYGQLVRPEDTPAGVGQYSTSIFDTRLQRYLEAVTYSIDDYASSHAITELIFVLGGDLTEGDEIFSGQAWQLEVDPARQVYEIKSKLVPAIRQIVRHAKEAHGVPAIGLYCVPGNHGKVGGKRGGARPTTYSWDWLASMLIADDLRAEPINSIGIEPGGALFFGAAGEHIFLTIHGDEVHGWGGLPFYGLSKFDGRMIRMRHTIYDYTLMGHHHQPASIPNGTGETIVSPDWVGGNNLSRQITAASRPGQWMLFAAAKYGITERSRIYFTSADEAKTPPTIYRAAA